MRYRTKHNYRSGFKPPEQQSGHLYYVRLKTSVGTMYKLGFTAMPSVHARLAYQGLGHEKMIDAVLLFHYLDDAWTVEQELHDYFRTKAIFATKEEHMPLFRNGQSELYRYDILGLDPLFKGSQSEATRVAVEVSDMRRHGATDDDIAEVIRERERSFGAAFRKGVEEAATAPPSMGMRLIGFTLRPIFELFYFILKAVLYLGSTPHSRAQEARVKALLAQFKKAADDSVICGK
jgi:hypothetical protein